MHAQPRRPGGKAGAQTPPDGSAPDGYDTDLAWERIHNKDKR